MPEQQPPAPPPPPRGPSLTPQQQQALATDRNISVTAGAGSGKTTILVERYLALLLNEKVDIRRILAITFTEKAAAEMTERTARILQQRLSRDPSPALRSRLLALRERLNSAQISTIHSFCARVLREFAVASGVDPDFGMLTDFQRDLMLQGAVDQVMENLNRGELSGETALEEWREVLRRISPRVLQQVFNAALENGYELQLFRERLNARSDEELLEALQQRFLAELQGRIPVPALLEDLSPLIDTLAGMAIPLEALKEGGRKLFERLREVSDYGEADPADMALWELLLPLSLMATTAEGQPYQRLTALGTKKELGPAYDLLFILSETIAPLAGFALESNGTVPGRLDLQHFALLRKILWLCEQVEGHYQQEKEGLGLLDFEDLQLKTLELLKNHADIRNTLRNRYRFIMVDEFQDTNQLQWDIISRIATHEGKLESQKLFVVGDPKQSIYGFRSADVRVFQRVKESFGGPENNIVLGESFRFLPGLNTFINRLFRTVLGDAAGNEFEVPYDHLETRREAQDNSRMELAILDPEWLRENQLSQEHYLASRIRRLLDDKVPVNRRGPDGEALQAIRPGDIAILIPRRTHLLRLESTLREYGVPFKTIGGVGFYRRQEVFDVYHLLRVLDNPGDDLALVALLRSPFAGISDVGLYFLASEKGETYREKLEALKPYGDYSPEDLEQLMLFRGQLTRWEQRRDRLSLSQLLNEIFDESFYRASLAAEWNGEQLLANLDKITEMARDYEQSGFTALADFFESLQQIIDLDPREGEAQIALEDENTIKIMTIHQSKGLEFPVVFCPYLDDPARPDIRQLRFESDLGLAVKLRDAGQQYQLTAPYLFQLIDARQKQKIQAERKRLFYVVVTRARDQVFLSGVGNPRGLTGETALGWAVQAMGLDPEAIPEGEFLWDGQLCINILQRFEANRPAPAGEVDPAAAVAGFREVLSGAPVQPLHRPDLLPLRDVPEGVTFSATQLLTFHNGDGDYFKRYHLGFFESDYEFVKELSDPDSLGILTGKIVHKILEDGIPQNPAEFERRLEQGFFLFEVFDETLQASLREEIPGLIEDFLKSDLARTIYRDSEGKAEISLKMRIGRDYFTGILDRIFKNEAGIWEVLDYKTNNITAAQVEKTGLKYDLQMRSYALLVSQLMPDQANFPVTLYFLRPARAYRRVFSKADTEAIYRDFGQTIEQIRTYYPFGNREPGR